jgi:hypothetical protein
MIMSKQTERAIRSNSNNQYEQIERWITSYLWISRLQDSRWAEMSKDQIIEQINRAAAAVASRRKARARRPLI